MTLDEVEQFCRATVLLIPDRDQFIASVNDAAKPQDETDTMMVARMARYVWDSTPRPSK